VQQEVFAIETADKAFNELADFGNELQGAGASCPWFYNLLVSLIDALVREYRTVKAGYCGSLALTAWGCRNLLELHVWTKYALQSGTNARALLDDSVVDSIEMLEAMDTWLHHIGGPDDGAEESVAKLKAFKTERKVKQTKHLNVRDAAKATGTTVVYQQVNRATSKLVHPTGFSLMVLPDEDRLYEIKGVLFDAGVRFGLEAGDCIRAYIAAHGLEPLPAL
jgi:hypothetical protein